MNGPQIDLGEGGGSWQANRRLIEHLLQQLTEENKTLRRHIEELRELIEEQREHGFTEDETKAVRVLIRDSERYRLAFGIMGRLSAYVAAIVGAIYGIRELLPKLWQAVQVVFT